MLAWLMLQPVGTFSAVNADAVSGTCPVFSIRIETEQEPGITSAFFPSTSVRETSGLRDTAALPSTLTFEQSADDLVPDALATLAEAVESMKPVVPPMVVVSTTMANAIPPASRSPSGMPTRTAVRRLIFFTALSS
ncbi:hypothetical protein PP1_024355 [Pseudonocardia sp. P1]